MKDSIMKHPLCDGLPRRDALRIGAAGLLGSTLTLPDVLNRSAAANEKPADDVSLIILFLHGGLSTIDTLDLKPDAPAEFRGDFRPIATAVPGIQVCEHLPKLAQTAHRFSLVRNFTHSNSDHGPADHYMLTGYRPTAAFNPNLRPNNQRPAQGAIIAKELGPRGGVPPFVCLPVMHPSCGPAYLGATCAPFVVEADPNAPNFKVPDLVPPMVVDAERLQSRKSLLASVDKFRRSAEVAANAKAAQRAEFQRKAFELVTSAETRKAFDLDSESPALRDDYGRTTLGQSCLMARRLVEAGVRCVTIDHHNWDTHYHNFRVLKNDLLPQLDSGLSALLRDLSERGTLARTLVAVFGEFGRTPRVNKDAGRDHWGPANTILLAGGGIRPGVIVGKTNPLGEKPEGPSHGPEDLSTTIFHLLGIDSSKEFYTPEGRPVPITNGGRLIQDVVA
jgi:uncharacterized protein (DUF1501 family)